MSKTFGFSIVSISKVIIFDCVIGFNKLEVVLVFLCDHCLSFYSFEDLRFFLSLIFKI